MRFSVFLLFLFVGSIGTASAQAVDADSTLDDPANVTYDYGNTSQVQAQGVQRVRRRIDAIRGVRRAGTSPVIVVVTPTQVAPGAAANAASVRPVVPSSGISPQDLRRLESNLMRRLDRRFDAQDDRLDDLDERLYQSERADRLRKRQADTVVRQPDRTTVVNEVERNLLETGLFRTIDVVFEFDKSTLLPISKNTLDAVGQVMQKYPTLRLEIGGHTDHIGTEAYNQRLSERRAASVRQYLLDQFGLDTDRLTPQGFGEAQPIASNANETGRTLNRRVEFRVLNRNEVLQQ